ncbi:MAG TPA: sugar ABC transporter substrate-binding protein [Clostridiaceae bacterium]|nr:sugar ABC transporter substrate-binding protein [Clostridiaceae bacterium]
MSKKIISVLLVVFLIASVFAGCASNTTGKDTSEGSKSTTSEQTKEETKQEEKQVSLSYWGYSRWKGITGTEPDGEYGDWQRSVAKAFSEQHPNVKIEYEHLPWDGGPEKVSVAIASKTQPDVLEDGTARFFGYAAMGALLPLDDYFTQEELSDYVEGAWDLGKFTDGKHYMFPWANMVIHLLINKSMFKAAGAEHLLPQNEERTWTYDEFKEALKAVSNPAKGVYGTALYAGNEQGDSGTNALMWGFGATIFNETLDKIVFNSPEGVKGVEFAKSLIDEGLAMPGAETIKATEVLEYFKQQKVAIHINGSSGLYGTVENAFKTGEVEEFEMDWAMYPTAPGVKPAFYANPVGLAVFKSGDADREKWAVELAKFATNTENSKALKAVKLIPVKKSAGNLYPGEPLMEWSAKVIKYARDPGLASPAYAEMRAALYPEMQAVYNGTKDPKTALDDFAAKAQASIDKYK